MSLDKGEILDDIHEGNSSLKSFMACVEGYLREREAEEFGKVGRKGKFKKYLHGCSDEEARLSICTCTYMYNNINFIILTHSFSPPLCSIIMRFHLKIKM